MSEEKIIKKGKSPFYGISFGVVCGAAAGAITLLLLPFVVGRLEDPRLAIDISALIVAAVTGFVAGKVSGKKCPEMKGIITGGASSLAIAGILLALSFAFGDDSPRTWSTFTAYALLILFSLIGAAGSKGKTKKKAARRNGR